MRGLLLAVAACIFLCSCESPKVEEKASALNARNYLKEVDYGKGRYFGFEIDKSELKNPKWFYVQEQQNINKALFELPAKSKNHSFYGEAAIYKIPKDAKKLEQLKPLLRNVFNPEGRTETISEKYSINKYKGVNCLRYHVETFDKATRKSKKPLRISYDGYVYFHPVLKDMAMSYYYCEKGTEKELKEGIFDQDGKNFLDAVKVIK
jgi:hypothetical protein